MKAFKCATLSMLAITPVVAFAQGVLEIPSQDSAQTGIGVVSGWHCNAQVIDVVIDNGSPLKAGSGTERVDTTGVCGQAQTGFSLLLNYNRLGDGRHVVVARADGVPFARHDFRVAALGAEFLTNKQGFHYLPNFPEAGKSVLLAWDEEKQNFSIVSVADPVENNGTYYGALSKDGQAARFASFNVAVANSTMNVDVRFVDGETCAISGPITDGRPSQTDGFLMAFYANSTCKGIPAPTVAVNGQQFTLSGGGDLSPRFVARAAK